MRYSECFHSVQGEGILTGVPSVFFRVSFCNLRCWWCDTPYTSWQPENKEITVDEALSTILKYNCKHVVLTGGEPFLWKKELEELTNRLRNHHKHITIETNGTIYFPVRVNLISMSPKLSGSTPSVELDKKWAVRHERERIKEKSITSFLTQKQNEDLHWTFRDEYDYQVKFVISTEDDFQEILEFEKKFQLSRDKILLMPEGRTKEEIEIKQKPLVEYCIENGYRFSDRLHTRIWGDKRGI